MSHIKRFAILVTLIVLALPTLAIEGELTIVGGDEAAMREFMEVYMRDMSSPDTETTIYIGELPEEVGVELPVTNDNIIGAIVREGPYSNTELIYTSTSTVEALETYYETEFNNLGWERVGINYGQRGFVVQEQAYADFCSPDKEKYINVNIRNVDDETVLRVSINKADPYMCNQGNMEEVYQNDPYLRLPELKTPEGVTMLMNRGGGGGGGGYPGNMYSATSTWLISEVLSLGELMEAYNTQLVANGWQQTSTETGEHISLSLWTFNDGETDWSGYFSLMESAINDGEYYATIMVEQVTE